MKTLIDSDDLEPKDNREDIIIFSYQIHSGTQEKEQV